MFLSIDTYSENLGIALIDGHKLTAKISLYKSRPFSELIVGKLDQLFNELGFDKKILTGVVVNKGPGSYTGLRVGISVAKTVAYSLNIPLYGYKSLDVIGYRYRFFKGRILVAINGGKGEAYIKEYISDGKDIVPVTDYRIEKIKDLRKDIEKYKDYLIIEKNLELSGKNVVKDIDDLSVEGVFYALKKNLKEDPLLLEPVYLRSL